MNMVKNSVAIYEIQKINFFTKKKITFEGVNFRLQY